MNNRTLKRPMFRIGGSAGTGITSGLNAPRQNYQNAGSVNQFEIDRLNQNAAKLKDAAMSVFLEGAKKRGQFDTNEDVNMMQSTGDRAVGGTSLEDAIAMARAKSGELSQMDPMSGREMAARFLIPFGLDFATRAPTGNLLSTAAASAKEPVDMLIKSMDARRDLATEKESDLFNTFLSAGLEDRRFERKQAAEKLKESQELLTLYDKEKQTNVIVKAGDVYKNLENYGPAKADKDGRPFEKIEVANQISDTMGRIFELQSKKERTIEEEQELKEAQTVLEYLKGSKNTKGFADALLKDPNFIQDLRSRIKARLEETEEFKEMKKEGLDEKEKLLQQQKIDEAVNYYLETGKFLPELMLADGGRVAYQSGGDVMTAAETPKIDFDTLRARLPKEIGDDIVRLIATSPEALEDFATIQTQQDVNNFNMKYDVELILPAEA